MDEVAVATFTVELHPPRVTVSKVVKPSTPTNEIQDNEGSKIKWVLNGRLVLWASSGGGQKCTIPHNFQLKSTVPMILKQNSAPCETKDRCWCWLEKPRSDHFLFTRQQVKNSSNPSNFIKILYSVYHFRENPTPAVMTNSVVPSKNYQNSVFRDEFLPISAVPQILMTPHIWM